MQFLVLSVVAFAAAISAQLLGSGGIRETGENIGSQIGKGVGGAFANVLENTLLPGSQGNRPQYGTPGYDRNRNTDSGRYGSGSRGGDGTFNYNQGSETGIQRQPEYQQQNTGYNKNQWNGYESPSDGQRNIRGGSSSAYDNSPRGHDYNNRYIRGIHRIIKA